MDKYRALVAELSARPEVRDVVVSTIAEGNSTLGKFGVCSVSELKDIEKTVRRMFAASSTIGSTLRRVTMHLGSSALVAYVLSPEVNLLLFVESDANLDELAPHLENFCAVAAQESEQKLR